MRISHESQLSFTTQMSKGRFAQTLIGLDQHLRDNPQLGEWVAADLPRVAGSSTTTGRPGLSGEQVLRLTLVRSMEECSFEDLHEILLDSTGYRSFCHLGWGDPTPSESTLQENIRRVRPETWARINAALVELAVKLKVDTGARVRFDCTVTASNIHPPDDAAQLWDVVRVLVRLLRRGAAKRPEVTAHNRTKRAKRRRMETMTKDPDERRAAYVDLLRVTEEVLGWADEAVPLLRAGETTKSTIWRLSCKIEEMAALGRRAVDQTRRRVLLGETVPATEKLVSVFEPHTDIIVKDRREVQYGHKLLLATGESGLVQHVEVLKGNPADSTLVETALDALTETLGRTPRQVAFDGGFASKANLAAAKKRGVKDVCFSKRRGMKVKDMARSEHVYRQLWRFRAGIEAGISWLKRCFGLDRARWRGEDGFNAYVLSNVVTFNLVKLAKAHHRR